MPCIINAASSCGRSGQALAAGSPQLRTALRSTTAARPRLVPGRSRCLERLAPRAGMVAPPTAEASSPEGPGFFVPLIGETIKIVQEPITFFEDRRKTYGPVFKTHFAGEECIAVADTALIKEIFAAEHESVKFEISKSIDVLTKSKILSRTSKTAHKMDRKFLGKYFTTASIASYYPFIQSDLTERMDKWVNDAQAIKFTEESKAFAFSVMNTQLAGVEFSKEQLEELDRLFYDFTNGATDLFALDLPWTAFGKGKIADEGICKVIQASLEKTYGAGIKERNFSDENMVTGFLLQKEEDGSWKYTIAETAQVMRSILFAGHETTAGSIAIMMHFVTRHPDVLEKIREEQQELVERHGSVLTPEILEGTYTEAVTVECLRLQNIDKTTRSPSVLNRRALEDFEIAGKLVKKGEKVLLATGYSAASVEEFLPTIEEFKPERWVIPGKSAVATYKATDTSIFGGGPRICLGEALAWAEMKVFLALLGRKVSWELINPEAEWKRAQGSLFLTPEDGMLIKFKSLSN